MNNYSITNKYIGDLRTTSEHLKSGNKIKTDAPLDNNGKGETFAPTDLVSSALCSCMMTVMGICAEKRKFQLPKFSANITKLMNKEPRKISEIVIVFDFEQSNLTNIQKNKLIQVATNCPVAKSLNPDIKQTLSFNF